MLYFDRINVSEGINVNKTKRIRRVIFATIVIFKIKALSFAKCLQ